LVSLFIYLISIINLYALFTIDFQSWLTRWDKKRMATQDIIYRARTYTIIGIFLAIISFTALKIDAFQTAYAKKNTVTKVAKIDNYKEHLVEENLNYKDLEKEIKYKILLILTTHIFLI